MLTPHNSQRDQAYAIAPYPGFGLWGFTRIHLLATDPRFQLAIARLTATESRDAILDLGCGLGQNIRQFAQAGVPPAKLFAADLRADLMQIGFEMFRDRERLAEASFVTGNALAPDDAELNKLHGKVSIVHAANFFHLFSWDAQRQIGVRMDKLLQGKENVFVFGRHVGSLESGDRAFASHLSEEQYLHDQGSFQRLWDEIGDKTGSRWEAKVEVIAKMPPGYEYLGEAARYTRFVVWRRSDENAYVTAGSPHEQRIVPG